MSQPSIQHCFICTFARYVTLLVITLIVQGCAHETVYRGISPSEAEAYVVKRVGITKPENITLAESYLDSDVWYLQDGTTWNCNGKHTKVVVRELRIKSGPGNSVQATVERVGDCVDPSDHLMEWVGRYDKNFLYLYLPSTTTYILKFKITKTQQSGLEFLGILKYIDDVWALQPAMDNFTSGHTGTYYYGTPRDIRTQTDYAENVFHVTAREHRLLYLQDADERANESAKFAADRRAEAEASRRESEVYLRNSVSSSISQNTAILAKVDQQTNNVIAESNRVSSEQAAAKERARAEREEGRKNEDRRNEEARQSRERLAQVGARDRENQSRVESERAVDLQRNKQEEQRREEQRRKDQLAQQEHARQQEKKAAQDKADRKAKIEAENEKKLREQNAYLAAMKQGIRLVATKCPDNAGHYYATGKAPKVKGSSCVDVYYKAGCPGSRIYSEGVAKNFIGMSGCFGDTYQIEPKPACPVDQVRMEVTDVRPGCN